jgi:hypothetical protein
MEGKTRNPRGERLIDPDDPPRRGEKIVGPIETESGPKRLVIHWRRVKRLSNSDTARLRREVYGRTA